MATIFILIPSREGYKKSPARDASIYSSTLSQGYNLKDKIFRLPKRLLYLLQMYIHDVPNSHLFLLKL